MKKTFLISGISSGIGKAFSTLASNKGFDLIPIVRSQEQAKGYAKYIVLDYSQPEAAEASFSNFKDKIDAFINFASLLPGKSFKEYDAQMLQELMSINVITPTLICKAIEKNLKDQSAIILFGSVSAQKGSYDDGYAASKGAVHSLVKSLALKFAPKTRVVGIAPAMTNNTRMTEELVPGRFEHNLKTIPLQKAGEPENIAELACFLTTENCQFMTGCMIDVNGGQYLR